MDRRKGLLCLLAIGCSWWQFGCPSCPYDARCEGNVLHTCTVGIDQLVGSPERSERECLSPNPVCVDIGERNAMCAMEDQPGCDLSLEPYCGEGTVISCIQEYLVAEDCAGHGNECYTIDGQPRCALPPLTRCEPDRYTTHCEDTAVISCDRGVVVARDCASYDPPGDCWDYHNEYGWSAYCD